MKLILFENVDGYQLDSLKEQLIDRDLDKQAFVSNPPSLTLHQLSMFALTQSEIAFRVLELGFSIVLEHSKTCRSKDID